MARTRNSGSKGSDRAGIFETLKSSRPWAVTKDVVSQVGEDHLMAFASAIAFRAFFTIFPLFVLLLSILGLVNATNVVRDGISQLGAVLPSDAASLIEGQLLDLANSQASTAFTIGAIASLLLAIWSLSAGARTVMEAMNVMYDVEESRPFVKRYLLSIGLALLLAVLMVTALAMIVLGGGIASSLGGLIGLESTAIAAWELLRWPAAIAFVLLALAVVYRWAPNHEGMRFRLITPGTVFGLVGWLVFSGAFAWYVQNFGSYNETYGSFAGIVLLLLYSLYTSAIILIGAELDQVIESRREA